MIIPREYLFMKKINFSGLKNSIQASREKFLLAIKVLANDIIVRSLVALALLLNVFAWAISFFINFRVQADVIALHYNIYFGITLIDSPKKLYLVPILGLFIIIVNLIVAYIIQYKNNFFVYLLTSANVAINFFLLLGIGSIMLVNFY